ncbi:MAG TPA: molybdenum cofactor guanylyltransferase [Calditrichaeota bacterium]|nr:molybdenum cofactor guanylyltransferase [Calditrichota bacterium]
MIDDKLSAAILGGGKSRRFGEPKAFAVYQGKKLIDYAVDLAKQIAPHVFLVNGRTVGYEEVGIPIISDLIPDLGPIGGLYTALKSSTTPYIAALPVDTPLLTVAAYRLLFQYMEKDRPVVALSDKGLEPLISIWPASMLYLVEQQIQEKNYSLRALFSQNEAVVVDFPQIMEDYNPQFFLNINYKKDLLAHKP